MPIGRFRFSRWMNCAGLPAMAAVLLAQPLLAQDATQPADALNPENFYGKEPTEGVYVRDSAGATEKLALAEKMERLKEWSKSADLYQEVITRYADRVVPSQLDNDKKIYQYTSITNPVQERLSHWPQEGLDLYRARFETPAQTLLDTARPDDAAALSNIYRLYFVTEAGKQAGIRLIDLYLESGEYSAAAWLGDRLLSLHPTLSAERPGVLYRTALAYYYAGDADQAHQRLDQLKARFAQERGVVRGKDVLLADSLAHEIVAPVAGPQSGTADSWPVPFGDNTRGRISSAEGRPGARLYGITLPKPNWNTNNPSPRDALQKAYDDAIGDGLTLGILPVVDRGELFFQDGQRIFARNLDSGAPLSGWAQTYANGVFALPGVFGSQRGHQLSVALTDHAVLAVMGQPDTASMQAMGIVQNGEAKLVCLDRQSGVEKWTAAPSQLPDEAKDARTLQLSGSPLVIGDNVLVTARGRKTQFEDCFVLAFDLATGHFRWSTYIASASSANMMWGDAPSPTENSSHLASANGRVYVQTNLGALAALDAYSGAVVWLDIYPTGRAAMERQQFNPFAQGSQFQPPPVRPWSANPVIVQNGYVFTLPSEGHHLLVYDAGTGVEVKRVDLKDMEEKIDNMAPCDTLVGVLGDKIILSGDKAIICFKWKNYTKAAFDPRHDENITMWPCTLGQPIRGRAFIAAGSLLAPCADHLLRIDIESAKATDIYPRRPEGNGGTWEAPEEPGNVLATSDYVIIAGARSVNVYTDLALAKAKLDRELAAAPKDPQIRLHYAELTFVGGDVDTAIAKLDEAAQLLGGAAGMVPGAARDRLFNDALTFAEKLSRGTADVDFDRAGQLYDRAATAAASTIDQVRYRLSRAKLLEDRKEYVAAVKLYEEVLADPQMRRSPVAGEASSNNTLQADGVAEEAIAALIKAHPDVYESFEQAAAAAMEAARSAGDGSAARLLEVARTYPNSAVAARAMIAAADAFEASGDARRSIRVLRDIWFKYPQSPDKAAVQESIARNYLALASVARTAAQDRGAIDDMEAAAAALARASALPGEPKLSRPMVLRDGATIAPGTPVSQALDAVRKLRVSAVSHALPDLRILTSPVRYKPYPAHPFLPEDPARDVIDNIRSLVIAVDDFARSDRLVACGEDGMLQIFAAGEVKPLVSTNILGEEARGCAWNGDDLLVWGATQAADVNAASGQSRWKLNLKDLPMLEVARLSDVPQNIGGVAIPNDVVIVGGRRRPGRNFQRQNAINQGAQVVPVGQPQRPIPEQARGAAEEINEVRPVGDHLLMTTTAGRILSVELAGGHIAWQARLTDRAVDRLVANEDFAVVRVSDDNTVRLAAFDTATGQLRCTRSWDVHSPIFPVNLALAADGTLVFTMPDRLCLKDLYKPWPDPTDKEVQGSPGVAVFQRDNRPDQLLVSEGRILALADDGGANGGSTFRYVRLHSLETGQPIPLRYRSPEGDKEVDRVLNAGKSEQVSLHVVGSHLYIVNPQGAISYDLDRPTETWTCSDEEYQTVRDAFITRTYVALVLEPPSNDDAAAPPVPVNPAAPNGNVNPPAPAPGPQPAGSAPAPLQQYVLKLVARYPTSDANPAECGRLDYVVHLSDPAGIMPTWQVADGCFYYLTANKKLHLMRPSPPPQ